VVLMAVCGAEVWQASTIGAVGGCRSAPALAPESNHATAGEDQRAHDALAQSVRRSARPPLLRRVSSAATSSSAVLRRPAPAARHLADFARTRGAAPLEDVLDVAEGPSRWLIETSP